MKRLIPILLSALLAGQTLAADLIDTVRQRGTLKIALEGTYPPFNYREGKTLTGFEVELGQELARRLGVRPEFVTGEWSGLLAGLQGGKFDVVMNQVAVNEARARVFDFSRPYTISSAQLVVRKNETRTLSGANLRGTKVGVGQGSNYADLARRLDGVEVKVYPGAPEYLQDLASGRIDAALNDSLLIPFAIRESRLPLKAGAPVGSTATMAIPFAKGNPGFKRAIDQALLAMQQDGSFARISNKWFGQDVSQPPAARKAD